MTWLLPLALLLAVVPVARADDACAAATTQVELNRCAGESLAAAEAELGEAYREILDALQGQALALDRFKAAHRQWSRLRDADLAALHPVGRDQDARVLYGSMHPMLQALARERITRARVAWLRHEFLQSDGAGR